MKFPIEVFFNTVANVAEYKLFVPWCHDSWILDRHNYTLTRNEIYHRYNIPSLNKVLHSTRIKEPVHVSTFDGGMKVDFKVMNFSYVSKVTTFETNAIYSSVNNNQSNIFKKLNSLWIIEEITPSEKNNFNNLQVDYSIEFEFKSWFFSAFTNTFLNFLGDNIMNAFIKECDRSIKSQNLGQLNQTSSDNPRVISHLNDTIKGSITGIPSLSSAEREKIHSFFSILHKNGKFSEDETNLILKEMGSNITLLKNIIYFSELVSLEDTTMIDKITDEIKSAMSNR